MQEYSAYIVEPKGHTTQRIDLLCADEADAHQQTRRLVNVDAVELWHHDRLVATFVPCLRAPLHVSEISEHTRVTFTERQRMIVAGVCNAMTNKQIASELDMSEHTVKVHLRHVMQILNAQNRTAVAILGRSLLQD